jgi:predicted glycosyltransferase
MDASVTPRWSIPYLRPARRPRIAMYSPGMVGLGHIRRNLLISQELASSPLNPTILLLAEAREAGAFAMPDGVDCVTLPALRKDHEGECRPRHMDLPLRDVVALRAETTAAALRAFRPDFLLVDHLPRGAFGELEPGLTALRKRGGTRCVLGLRDVLEEPSVVRREWRRGRNAAAVGDYYDAVWIYGDPAVYDALREYQFPSVVTAKARYVGYLDSRRRLDSEHTSTERLLATLGIPVGPLTLCLVGGGQDGGPLALAFLDAELPPDSHGVVVTGPYMAAEFRRRLHYMAARRPGMKVVEFLPEPAPLLHRAERVVAMGGYNNVCDVLAFRKRALIVPRGGARREQRLRAGRLQALGAFDVLPPEALTARAISEWMAHAPAAAPDVTGRIDLNGLARLPGAIAELLNAPADVRLPAASRTAQIG